MIRRRSHPDSTVSTTRTEAYTDAVFAIAATLLVLDLTTRSFTGIATDADLAAALLQMTQPLMTFVISFLILSLMWMTHVSQFENIARIDGLGLWINNLRLLFIVLVPFTSSLTTDYSDLLLGRILLPINFFLAIACSWAQWAWSVRHREEVLPGLSEAEARRQGRAALSAAIIAAAVVVASPWVGSFAFFLFALDGPLTRLLGGSRSVEDAPTPPDDPPPAR
ncbi:TMEM175 family protein [Microbacterium sp. 18062]|uniref:TMEM175 family protein n=1 Tax=Microbacterium sp. 18062 TaxID=2681410 RepID=UPI00135CB2A8|nr:TMEM175 family protein [Microbacterium sp. 18062]